MWKLKNKAARNNKCEKPEKSNARNDRVLE